MSNLNKFGLTLFMFGISLFVILSLKQDISNDRKMIGEVIQGCLLLWGAILLMWENKPNDTN